MPNIIRQQEFNLGPFASPDTFNSAALYMPGQLGMCFDFGGNVYLVVQLESGATAPIAGQVMFWKSRSLFTVTNVKANAKLGATTNGWRNEVAGICRLVATAGNFICLLVAGIDVPVSVGANTTALGDLAIADVTANVGNALNLAAGTAATYEIIGVFTSVTAATLATCDVALLPAY